MVQCRQECHLLSYLSVGLEGRGRGGKGEGREAVDCVRNIVKRETSQWIEQVGRENMYSMQTHEETYSVTVVMSTNRYIGVFFKSTVGGEGGGDQKRLGGKISK